MCDFDDDGIGAEELGIFLGIVDEMDEEARARLIDNEPMTLEEILEGPFDYLDEE